MSSRAWGSSRAHCDSVAVQAESREVFACKIGVLSDVEKVETFSFYLFVFFFGLVGTSRENCAPGTTRYFCAN